MLAGNAIPHPYESVSVIAFMRKVEANEELWFECKK